MAYFTIFQYELFPTAELPRGEREKIDEFLRLLEDSGVGEIIHKETQKDKSLGGRNSYNPYRLFASIIYALLIMCTHIGGTRFFIIFNLQSLGTIQLYVYRSSLYRVSKKIIKKLKKN